MSKKQAIRMFNAKEIGSSLQEVAAELIKREDQNIESRWFHSNKDADLFIWRDQLKNVIKQQVTYFGQLVEWNVLEGVRTGMLIEDETSQQISASPIIQYDLMPQQHAVSQCIELLGYVPGLTEDDKSQLIHNYMQSPKFADQSPDELIKKYAYANKATPAKGASVSARIVVSVFLSQAVKLLKKLLLRFK